MTPAMQEFIDTKIPRIFSDYFDVLEIEPDCDPASDVYDVHVQVRISTYKQVLPVWLIFCVRPGIAMLNIHDETYVEANREEVYAYILHEYGYRLEYGREV